MELVVGVDVHKLEHVAAAIDETGRSHGQLTFKNTGRGFDRLLIWLKGLGAEHIVIGTENAGGYGATLTVALARSVLTRWTFRLGGRLRNVGRWGRPRPMPGTPRPSRVSLLVTELGWRLRCSPNWSERSA
jgi:Transposase